MKKSGFVLMLIAVLSACSDEMLNQQPAAGGGVQPAGAVLTRITGDCSIGDDSQRLVFTQTAGGYTTRLQCFGVDYVLPDDAMVMLQVWRNDLATSAVYTASYDSILTNAHRDSLVACATVTTQGQSVFFIRDTYSTSPDRPSLRLSRSISVSKKAASSAAADYSYNSLLLIRKDGAQHYTENEYYLPALVFKDGSNMGEASIGSCWTDSWILAREERMGLPLTMMRDKSTGVALSLCHYSTNPATINTDWGNTHMAGSSFRYASLGFHLENESPALACCYPGSEGERSYSDGGSHNERLWARRSTLLSTSVQQTYTVDIMATKSSDFAEAQRDHWRAAFDTYAPEELDVKAEDVLTAGLEVLDHYWLKSGDAPGFPFSVYCASGAVCETSFDMGFVGMQASCGYYLYRYGLDHGNETYRKKGEQVLDFWANRSANAQGMPRIWYDVAPWNSFRNYNDLRNMQGGMEAMLLAWSCAEAARPGSHDNWLRFCKNAADWMVKQQRPDGSLPKAFDNEGNVVDNGTYLTSNVIRFLTAMYGVTARKSYRDAVVRAAEWCMKNIHEEYKYIGSVIDNPYVKDRESGQKMIEAMLAAYDLTGDNRYLDAASRAAYYTVSYMYARNIPWETGTTLAMPWPKDCSTAGITIIATGHSGADCGFSYNSFEYLRLYELTGDTWFLRIAGLLEKNTKQTMDIAGKLHYPFRGLQREAIRCVTHRGDGVALWLPWCTASALDPLFRMEDAYGRMGIDNILTGASRQAVRSAGQPLNSSRYARKLGMVRLPDGVTY